MKLADLRLKLSALERDIRNITAAHPVGVSVVLGAGLIVTGFAFGLAI